MRKQPTAWLSIGSIYTYLTAFRLEQVITRHDVDILVKPISIRSIMREMDNSPFPSSKPEKVRNIWRDIEWRAAGYGLPAPKVPAPYPLTHFDRANLFGIVMAKQGRYIEYLRETYSSWFLNGHEAGGTKNLIHCCNRLELDYDTMLAGVDNSEVKQIYENNTKEARQFSIFGVPSFSINDEIFRGDDRLEDAILFKP